MSRSENRKEFIATGAYGVRRRAEGNIYAPEKLKDAREWLYEQDTKYQRRADIKGTIAIVISMIALAISAAGLAFEVWPATHGVSAYLTAPKESAASKPGTSMPTPPKIS